MRRFLLIGVIFMTCAKAPVNTTVPTDAGTTTYTIVDIVGPDGAIVGRGIQSN